MFCAMIVSAWAERVPVSSCPMAALTAARTSGGRSVDVLTMRSRTESKNCGSIRQSSRNWRRHRRTPSAADPAANIVLTASTA